MCPVDVAGDLEVDRIAPRAAGVAGPDDVDRPVAAGDLRVQVDVIAVPVLAQVGLALAIDALAEVTG